MAENDGDGLELQAITSSSDLGLEPSRQRQRQRDPSGMVGFSDHEQLLVKGGSRTWNDESARQHVNSRVFNLREWLGTKEGRWQAFQVIMACLWTLMLLLLLTVGISVRRAEEAPSKGGPLPPSPVLAGYKAHCSKGSWLCVHVKEHTASTSIAFELAKENLGSLFIRSDLTEKGTGQGGMGEPNIAHTQVCLVYLRFC